MIDLGYEGFTGIAMGAMGLGLLHGLEPGHGWPVAAAWALGRKQPRSAGVLAACILGVGHLISSLAVVLLFFVAQQYFEFGDTRWIDYVAGSLLIVLAAWQVRSAFLADGHHHHHDHDASSLDAKAGLGALAVFAFTLGFVHEEEFQIIAMCAGSGSCLTLMLIYAIAVIVALVVLTLLLIQGLSHLSHRIEHAQRALTLVSASILALMGIGFLFGFF